jgi:hypothetical protein
MTLNHVLKPLVASALLAACAASQATLTIYNTQGSFLAAATDPGTDTFEDLAPATSYPGPLVRSAGTHAYEVDTGDGLLYGAGGPLNSWLSNNLAVDTITFSNFDADVNAAGGRFFGSDINGKFQSGQTLYITATDADGSLTYTLTNAKRVSFVGFVSDGPLLSLTVSADQSDGPVWGTVNNFVLGAVPVPEPETWAMMFAGLAAVGFVARRRG